MEYTGRPDQPRILMIDCEQDLVAAIKSAGYNVEVGYSGVFVNHPIHFSERLHEKDVLIVDLDPGWEARPAADLYPPPQHPGTPDNIRSSASGAPNLERFTPAFQRGAQIICLLDADVVQGGFRRWQSLEWIPGSRVSSSSMLSDDTTFRLAAFSEVLEFETMAKLLRDQNGAWRSSRILLNVPLPLLVNDAGEVKAGYQQVAEGAIWYLPRFERKSTAVRRMLQEVLPLAAPDLFPARETAWQAADEYQMEEVMATRRRRHEASAEHARLCEELDGEEASAVASQAPFTALLTATSEDLRKGVQHALEWLEFEDVVDADAARAAQSKGKDEDIQLKEGDYFALVEVTSGKGNAREADFQDLQKYIHRRQRHPGRDDINPLAIRGLLVMNQHYEMEPVKRPNLYEGNENNYAEHAAELEIGLLSTYDLFKLIQAVQAGALDKRGARELVMGPGLIKAPSN